MVRRSCQLSAVSGQLLSLVVFIFPFALCLLSSSALSQHMTSSQRYQAEKGDIGNAQDTPAEKMYQVATQGINAKAFTDKSDYLVGDYITYTIQVIYNKDLNVYAPILSDSIKNVSMIRNASPIIEERNKQSTVTYRYIFSGYDSTGVTIPSAMVPYKLAGDTMMRYASTNPVSFTVRTLPVNLKNDIQDVKSPIKIPLDWRWILLWIAVVFIIGGAVWYIYKRYKRKKSAAVPEVKIIKRPPHEIALSALQELEKQKLWQKGLIKEYHSGITEIIRKYFEERFNLPALELTTSETVELIKVRKGSEQILDTTYDFLSNADLVKFAKFMPLDSVNEITMKQAHEIINKTIPAPAEENSKVATPSEINADHVS